MLTPGPLFLLIAHWLVSALAIFVTAKLVPGFRVKNFTSALIAAAAVSLLYRTVGYVLLWLTLPLTVLTLGLFWFVVYGIVLKLSAALLRDFEVRSWFAAILGAVLLTFISEVLHFLVV